MKAVDSHMTCMLTWTASFPQQLCKNCFCFCQIFMHDFRDSIRFKCVRCLCERTRSLRRFSVAAFRGGLADPASQERPRYPQPYTRRVTLSVVCSTAKARHISSTAAWTRPMSDSDDDVPLAKRAPAVKKETIVKAGQLLRFTFAAFH